MAVQTSLPLPQPAARAVRPAAAVAPWLAVGTLVALPLAVYGISAMLGHSVDPGDDLTQNLPLRILVGRDLSQGHLPVFDPYIWSGAPLLAGWNAGAAYPLTWLFAVLPATAAWTVDLAAASAVAGVGCYAFLRACRLGVVASWLGGLTFAFGGAMTAQIPHLGLITGMSWTPVAALAVLRLTEPEALSQSRRGRFAASLGWTALLAGAVGMVILAGEPRAITNAGAVLVLYGVWRVGRLAWHARRRDLAGDGNPGDEANGMGWARPSSYRQAGVAAAAVAGGAALGVGLGAVQLLPGLAAVASSQRAAVTATLFSSGSLPARWLLLVGVPDLLGGSGSWGQPSFFATYNLTEITAYVGVLPLVAAGGLLGRLRRHRPLPEWVIWYAVGAAGVLLALGTNTPLWHLLIHVPLFGGQRLQSRSIMVTDLALAVLLAYWADGWLARPRARLLRPVPGHVRRELVLGAVPAVCVAGLVVLALAWQPGLVRWMGVAQPSAAVLSALDPWLVPFLCLGLGAVALVWGARALGRRWRGVVLSSFVVVDLALFVFLTVLAAGTPPPGTVTAAGASSDGHGTAPGDGAPAAARPIATLHLPGRFAVYDPTLLDPAQLSILGVPDSNVTTGTYAVQGYSSLADADYARATGTHRVSGTGQNLFAPEAAEDGVLDALDTTAVFVPSPYLVTPLDSAGPEPGPDTGTRRVGPGQTATWYLGTPVQVTSLTVPVAPAAESAVPGTSNATVADTGSGSLRLGIETASGRTVWLAAHRTGAVGATSWEEIGAPDGPAGGPSGGVATAIAVVAEAVGGTFRLGAPTVVLPGGVRDVANGQLALALTAPHWLYGGRDGPFAVFRNRRATPGLTLHALSGRSLGDATVRRLSGPAVEPDSAAVSSPGGAEVVRSVAAIPGWTATWQPAAGGAPRPLAVRRDGVVQSVDVPPGAGVVTWRYHAPGLVAGAAVSAAALFALLVLAGAALVAGTRRRRGA